MRSITLKLTAVIALLMSFGIASAGNHIPAESLPKEVKTFFTKYFAQTRIVDAEFEYGIYEIELSDGYEVKINAKGEWLAVEAPDHVMIPLATLKALVPKAIVDYLVKNGLQDRVDELSFYHQTGYKLDIEGSRDLYFTKAGALK